MYRGPRPHRGSYPPAASRGFAPRDPPPADSFPSAPYRNEQARDSNGYQHAYRRHPEHPRRRYLSPGRGSAEDFRGDGPPPRDYGHVGWLDYYTLLGCEVALGYLRDDGMYTLITLELRPRLYTRHSLTEGGYVHLGVVACAVYVDYTTGPVAPPQSYPSQHTVPLLSSLIHSEHELLVKTYWRYLMCSLTGCHFM